MSKPPRILIAIADGEHARFVRPRSDHVLRTERCFDSAAAHKKSAELGTDHPGAAFHSEASVRHGLTPRHDLQDLEKAKFARLVAQQLNEISAENAFDALVVAAPPEHLQVIRAALNSVTQAKILGTLNKDLVKVPDDALLPHLREWLPAERPVRQKPR
jgi:protein required for attachment to host cells